MPVLEQETNLVDKGANFLRALLKAVPAKAGMEAQINAIQLTAEHPEVAVAVQQENSKREYGMGDFLTDVKALTDQKQGADEEKTSEVRALGYATAVIEMKEIFGQKLHPQTYIRALIDGTISDAQKDQRTAITTTVNRIFNQALGFGMQAQPGNEAQQLKWGEPIAQRLGLPKPTKVPPRMRRAA